jgi:glutamate carboxypeptidase
MTGPGVLDMKSGLVIALHTLAETRGASLLVTADEELGSPSSCELIESAAAGKVAVLVLEPAVERSLKIARKGVARYVIEFTGKAAHAGLEPGLGANALIGMSNAVLAVTALSDSSRGTTVTPTLATAGTSSNTVPDTASFSVDVRTWETDEALRVEQALRALSSQVDGVEIHLVEGPARPPFGASASTTLFELARQAAASLGFGSLQGASVGGGSDGNFAAAMGVATLDGLGAVGGGAHTAHEWVDVRSLAERSNLLTALISRCLHLDT